MSATISGSSRWVRQAGAGVLPEGVHWFGTVLTGRIASQGAAAQAGRPGGPDISEKAFVKILDALDDMIFLVSSCLKMLMRTKVFS